MDSRQRPARVGVARWRVDNAQTPKLPNAPTSAENTRLLTVGKVLRVQVPLLQRLYLPSSVIGGVVGLILFSSCGSLFPAGLKETMSKCPGFLINVIFATIFLGAAVPKVADVVRFALPQLTLGQIIAWGQYVVGLAVLIGYGIHRCIPMSGFPLFPLCMVGGVWSVACVLFVAPARSSRRADAAPGGPLRTD